MGAQGNFVIRKAEKKDACLVLEFIRKIAEYERDLPAGSGHPGAAGGICL